jgi:serine protease Do
MKLSVPLCQRGVLAAALALSLLWAGAARAQTPAADFLRNNPKIVKLFRSVVAGPSESTVRVICNGKDAALGTIVAADGWIITKASELKGKVICRLKDGREYDARIVGVQEPFDLALLKIDATSLKPVMWRDSKEAKVGRWVASVGPGEDPVAIGVISVATRGLGNDQPAKALMSGGWLGVVLEDAGEGVRIVTVMAKSPAAKAGVKMGDVVTHINAKKVLGMESMQGLIQKHKPGEEITLAARRGDEDLEFKAKLEKRPAFLDGAQDTMGSALSNRRGGFPRILQHDTIIKPADCGGPLVDLDGKAVGINIARAGRTESYAIPSEVVRDLLPELMSGRLAPPPDEPEEPPSSRETKRDPTGRQ